MTTLTSAIDAQDYATYERYLEAPHNGNVHSHTCWLPDVLPGLRPVYIVFLVTDKGTIVETPEASSEAYAQDFPSCQLLAVYDYLEVVNLGLGANLLPGCSAIVRDKILPDALNQHFDETIEYYRDFPEYWDVEIKGPEHDWMAPETPWERDN